MIETDTVLTTRYGLVDDADKTPPALATAPGPQPALNRSAVVTWARFGQWAQFPSERAFYRYADWQPPLRSPPAPSRSPSSSSVSSASSASS